MRRITLLCVGKLKERFYIQAAEEYAKRLGRYCKLEVLELPEQRLGEAPSPAEVQRALAREAEALRGREIALIPQGVPAGEWAAKQILAGEAVRFYATETPPGTPDPRCWDVTLEKLRAGVWRYLTAGLWFLLDDGVLDAELLEPEDTVPIIVFAMFEDGSAGKEECV